MSNTKDWLYLKTYTGSADDVGATLPVLVAWMNQLSGVECWHFIRYMDFQGHHLRIRLKGYTNDVDAWYTTLPMLRKSLKAVSPQKMERIIFDPMTGQVGSRRGVTLDVYSPELEKYGGLEGMKHVEQHFQDSSLACTYMRIWNWGAQKRAVQVAHYISAVQNNLVNMNIEMNLPYMIADRWRTRLVYAGISPQKLNEKISDISVKLQISNTFLEPKLCDVAASSAELIRKYVCGEIVAPQNFPLDIVHMDINRIGLNPLEECFGAMLAAQKDSSSNAD